MAGKGSCGRKKYLAKKVIHKGTLVDMVQRTATAENDLDSVALVAPSKTEETKSARREGHGL